MVKFQSSLDATFTALADPTRRRMLERLSAEPRIAVSALAEPFAMSLPAALKHVNVLVEAGLIAREKQGRTVWCRIEAEPMREAVAWLERYEKFWSVRLDALAAYVEEDEKCPPSRSPASRSSGTSRPLSRKSSGPGPKAKP